MEDIYVNGGQLIQFCAAVNDLDRQDILNATLLAQLAANKTADWSASYLQSLRTLDWLEAQSQSWPLLLHSQQSQALSGMFNESAKQYPWIPSLISCLAKLGSCEDDDGKHAARVLQENMLKRSAEQKKPAIELLLCRVSSRSKIECSAISLPGIDLPATDNLLTHAFTATELQQPVTLRTSTAGLLDNYASNRQAVLNKLEDRPAYLRVKLA